MTSQIEQLRNYRSMDNETERKYIASKDGVLFQDWENYCNYPSPNDSGDRQK